MVTIMKYIASDSREDTDTKIEEFRIMRETMSVQHRKEMEAIKQIQTDTQIKNSFDGTLDLSQKAKQK